jgi:dienelactone hydrolase
MMPVMADTTAPAQSRLTIDPADTLYDAPTRIIGQGLPPGSDATLRLELRGGAGARWRSEATFVVPQSGTVDLSKATPQSGTYDGVEPMGLFWSAQCLEPGHPPAPAEQLVPWTGALTLVLDGQEVASTAVTRRFVADDIDVSDIREQGMVATLFRPMAVAPLPGVIVLTGSGGGLNNRQAALLASHGFVTLALAYFGIEHLPAQLVDIPLEYLETGLEWLADHPAVAGRPVGVVGPSKGGELALLLGATFPRVKAVVAYVPSGLVHQGISFDANRVSSSWTHRGEPLPFVSMTPGALQPSTPLRLREGYLSTLDDPARVAAATIAVERTNGAILQLSGEDDGMWPSTPFAALVEQRLTNRAFPHEHRHVSYPGAGHSFIIPNTPTPPIPGATFEFGGTPAGTAHAAEASWRETISFLDRHLGG